MGKQLLIKVTATMDGEMTNGHMKSDIDFYIIPEAIACLTKHHNNTYDVVIRAEYLNAIDKVKGFKFFRIKDALAQFEFA